VRSLFLPHPWHGVDSMREAGVKEASPDKAVGAPRTVVDSTT
jgi:hypothetical protein